MADTMNTRETGKRKELTPGQMVLARFLRNKLAIFGIVLIVTMAIFSLVGPFLSPYGEYTIFFEKDGVEFSSDDNSSEHQYSDEGVKVLVKSPPSKRHWLGTDTDGRDILTRLMYGGRVSLLVGFVVIGIELLLGVTMGGIAGYYGGRVDSAIMRVVDIFYCIPTLPILLILSSVMITMQVPQSFKIYGLMVSLGFLGWSGIARLVRGQILSLREQEYMVSAEAIGLRTSRKIFRHLIPNVMPQLIVNATLRLGSIILLESTLSYLGIGVPFPLASWGNMVNTVTDPVIMRSYMNIWVPPGLCILITVMGFNFIGDGLRDAFDPRMKR